MGILCWRMPANENGGSPAASSACKWVGEAYKCVPDHSGGVYSFCGVAAKTINPTPKGSVREPGSLTHPQVTPIEG